jgi:hypothetical protein
MARKPTLTLEALVALGTEKLAEIMLDEAQANPAFRKRVNAALAGTKGAGAVAKLIDRRLSALSRAKAMVPWERERALAEDLDATVDTIIKELAPLEPRLAVDRLLRFLDTHTGLFERIDDSSGRIQAVYWRAAEAFPNLAATLPSGDLEKLPERLTASLVQDTHGLIPSVAIALVPLLPETVLPAWDQRLSEVAPDVFQVVDLRQAIADARGDLDGYLALEESRTGWRRNPLAAAERLLAAGRLDEALDWVRRERRSGIAHASHSDLADGRIRHPHDLDRVRLEARILEARKDPATAQSLRWEAFESTLDAAILRDYIEKLGDFEEFDALDKAFAEVAASPRIHTALAFFLAWPRLDLAERLVLDRRENWDGRHYGFLAEAADILSEAAPLAATVLYRALLDRILSDGRSPAYGHGARYLSILMDLAPRLPADAGVEDHGSYVTGIKKYHGRKAGFWARVKDAGITP